ncbi:MAG: hypothetical protein H7A25_18150 [Leptospiraceae bacterium]|nr:hypothetical protein [Leptospiraceae bacterium]MCP5501830.1 hypothetical protein [Leptospiraceae bacterium]
MKKRIYLTYTKTNRVTGEIYSGRASGTDDPKKILTKRDSSHHINKDSYGKAILDEVSTNKYAIRGREQMLIDSFGGAQSEGGTSGNKINSISYRNKKREKYMKAAMKFFGVLSIISALSLFIWYII